MGILLYGIVEVDYGENNWQEVASVRFNKDAPFTALLEERARRGKPPNPGDAVQHGLPPWDDMWGWYWMSATEFLRLPQAWRNGNEQKTHTQTPQTVALGAFIHSMVEAGQKVRVVFCRD